MSIDTSKLKRYKPGYVHSNDGPGYISMLARDYGEYVRLDDVQAITSALEQALTQQTEPTVCPSCFWVNPKQGDDSTAASTQGLRELVQRWGVEDEDYHVIMSMGRLLAEIAVILKGAEPAGTAWSYHDLPELVASSLSEPRQVAAEMKAWAHTKMADQQSSRRDRMMVAEWAKRLLPESSFPVKDFDVEGMSITKDAAREAVKRVALEQALTQQRGECEAVAWQVEWIDNAGDPTRYIAYCEEDADDKLGVLSDGEAATAKVIPLYTTPQPSADAVREYIESLRKRTDGLDADSLEAESIGFRASAERMDIKSKLVRGIADELESLLGRDG